MLHNTGPFGPNDVPVNMNPQSNMTSMSGRMNIGNNINNLAKIPQQSPQAPNPHFNLPDYATYGLNMNAGLSPFQNFHHVGFQQNSIPQSSIHDSWPNNMLPMNLNMQSEHSMLGFAQYGKPEVGDQSFNKSMLNVPQVHTKAFHKQMGMDVNYHYNLNPSYRPYADYNLDLSSKKSDDARQFIDPNTGKERLALSPHYNEQIDLSNKQKMHSFTRPYLEPPSAKHLLSQKHDNNHVNINNDLTGQLQTSKTKHPYYDNSGNVKSQMNLDNRYRDNELDLSKSLKHDHLNANYQNASADLRYYKDHDVRPQNNDSVLPKFPQDSVSTNFLSVNSDSRIYKEQSQLPQNLEKSVCKPLPQQPENLIAFQNVGSDLRYYKDKDSRSLNVENTQSKSQKSENLNTNFSNTISEHRYPNEPKSTAQSNESTISNYPPATDLNMLTNISSDHNSTNARQVDSVFKEKESKPQNLETAAPKQQQPENLITNYQNINNDLRFYKDQDSRRRSLENTVKMIENILSHSSNSRKSQTTYHSKLEEPEGTEKSKETDVMEGIEKDVNNSNSNIADDVSSVDNLSNMDNKSDESDENTSNEMENDEENDNMDCDNQSNDESEFEDESKDNVMNQSKVSNTNDVKDVKELAYKSESEESSSEEDVKPKHLQSIMESTEIKMDDSLVVKVEVMPSLIDMEHLNPFHRDIFGMQNEDIANHDIIESETSITVAKEVIKTGSGTHGALFECPHCNLYFYHPKRFLIHTKWHSFGLTNEKRMELQKEKEMRKQMRKEARIVQRMNENEVMDANASGRKFNCRDCDKVFLAKASLKNHRQRYHPTRVRSCKICGKTMLGWMALRAHMATHTCDSGYQCDSCPKRFKHPHSLAKHRDTHLEKTQACPQCPKKFGSVMLLNVHMKTHERALRGATFRCTYCGKGFFESYSLQVHERTHRNERPYLCEICNTSFGTNSSLKRHLKVSHSTSKPFECSTCHRSFISEAIRDRHSMRNHGNPEDFKFVCKQCPCKYLKMKDLRKHMYKVHPKGKRKKKSQSDSE